MAKLERWSIVNHILDPDVSPVVQEHCLYGIVSGHPSIKDGHIMLTSHITSLEGDLVVTFLGTKFELGEIDPEYEKEFPGAKEKLFNSLREKESDENKV